MSTEDLQKQFATALVRDEDLARRWTDPPQPYVDTTSTPGSKSLVVWACVGKSNISPDVLWPIIKKCLELISPIAEQYGIDPVDICVRLFDGTGEPLRIVRYSVARSALKMASVASRIEIAALPESSGIRSFWFLDPEQLKAGNIEVNWARLKG